MVFQRLCSRHSPALQVPLLLYDLPLALQSATDLSSVAPGPCRTPWSGSWVPGLGSRLFPHLECPSPPHCQESHPSLGQLILSLENPPPSSGTLSLQSVTPPPPGSLTNSHVYFCTYPSLACVLYGGCSLSVGTPKLPQGATSQARVPGRFRGTLSSRSWSCGTIWLPQSGYTHTHTTPTHTHTHTALLALLTSEMRI